MGCLIRRLQFVSREVARPLAGGFLGLLVLFGMMSSAEAAEGVSVVRSSSEEAVIGITSPIPEQILTQTGGAIYEVPGWAKTYEIGGPELPSYGFQLALPPGKRAELSVRVLQYGVVRGPIPAPVAHCVIHEAGDDPPTQEVIRQREESLYAREYPAVWARLTGESGLRHLRVVGVETFPYHWDPASGAIKVASRLEVTVRFVSDPDQEKRTAIRQSVPGPDREMWDRIYRRAVLNADQALSWRRSPAGWEGLRGSQKNQTNQEFRIRVDQTGLYRIPYDSLVARAQAAGSQFGPVPIEQLALVQRFWVESDPVNPLHEKPVPIHVRDLNGNGVFDQSEDGPDEIVFFGLTIWDDPWYGREYATRHPAPKDRRYGRDNAYFLVVGSGGGAQMDHAGASYLRLTGLVSDTTFTWKERFEGEGVYMTPAAKGDGGDTPAFLTRGLDDINSEHFFWVGGSDPTFDRRDPSVNSRGKYQVPFDLPGFLSAVQLRLEFHGVVWQSGIPVAAASFWYTDGAGDTLQIPWSATKVPDRSRAARVLGAADLALVPWKAKGNVLLLQMPADSSGAALDRIDWTWRRNYEALDDRVAWTTESLTGPQEFALTGFSRASDDSLLLFDVTDSVLTTSLEAAVRGPRWYSIDPSLQISGHRNLTLQLELDGAPRVLLASTASALRLPKTIALVQGRDLMAVPDEGEEELIIIAAPEFVDGMKPLADLRRSEGFSVRVVSVRDVFDQFEGGRAWPTAIRSYLRYLFRARTVDPSFLLLVGDASDDFANVLPESAPDFVPTQTVFSWATGDQGSELVASDEWFVDNLTGNDEELDFSPEMAVGRLPVGSPAELATVVGKIVAYAQFSPTDVWRSRGLFVSDDEFSNRIGFNGDYKFYGDPGSWSGNESTFRYASRSCIRKIQRDAGFTDFQADSFYTAAYMDTVPTLHRCCEWETGSCPTEAWHLKCYNTAGLDYFSPGGDQHPLSDNGYYGLRYVRPKLRETMDRGYLLVNFQGHANAHLLTHEYIFVDQRFNNPPGDPDALRNEDRPFVFAGFGCHIAEFSAWDEGLGHRGDGIAERLLFQDKGRGSIASYASTGFEWLHQNGMPDVALIDGWFVNPPGQTEGKSRWILGEIINQSKAIMLAGGPNDSGHQGPIATYTLLGDPSLTMEMAPPRLQVEMNGAAWVEGDPVTAEAGSDTVRIRVNLKDESHLDPSGVTVTNAGVVVPDSLYKLTSPDPAASDRRLVLLYNTRLYPSSEDYVIEVSSRDLTGQVTSARMNVVTSARFQVLRGGVAGEIRLRGFVEERDTVLVSVGSPVDLREVQFQFLLGDVLLSDVVPTSSDPRHWEIRAVLPSSMERGETSLVLRIDRGDGGQAEKSLLVTVGGESRLTSVYNFPNPFSQDTQVFYTLNRSARDASLSIFTPSGRKIWHGEGSAAPDENVIYWDGLDSNGDPVANGLYFYKLEIHTFEGKTLSRIEKLARIR